MQLKRLILFVDIDILEQFSVALCFKLIYLALSFQIKTVIAKANGFSGGKQFSPVVFYGSPNGVPPKRPISYWRLLHEIRLDLSEKKKADLR